MVTDTKGGKVEFEENYNKGGFDNILNRFAGGSDIVFKKRLFSFIPKDNK